MAATTSLSRKLSGYCWRTPKCRNLSVQHAFLKAKKRGKLTQEKVLLELCRRFANSISPFCETSAGSTFASLGHRYKKTSRSVDCAPPHAYNVSVIIAP